MAKRQPFGLPHVALIARRLDQRFDGSRRARGCHGKRDQLKMFVRLTCAGNRSAVVEAHNVPPANVDDLSAVPGTVEGSINLSWTAPGDDGTSGTASHYIVKYSQSAIDAGSFNAATSAANPPTPVVGGATQNMVLSGLTPG